MAVLPTISEQAPPRHSWLGILPPAISSLTLALQNYALNVATPIMARDLGVSVADVSWVILGYMLVITATLIAGGRLGDVWGSHRAFSTGLALYLVGAIGAGAAPNLPLLFAARAVQGIGATLVISNQLALATLAAGRNGRGRAVSAQWVMANAGMVTGPAVGGVLTDLWSWRLVFWANVPVILILLVWCLPGPPARPAPRAERALDLPGLVLFGAAVGCSLLALNRAPIWGLLSPLTLSLIGGAALLGVTLYRHERATLHPMLDLRLLAQPAFATAIGSGMANHAALAGVLFLVPFYLVELHGLSAGPAGLVVIPMSILMMCISAGSGLVTDRIGPRAPAVFGLACMSVTLAVLVASINQLEPPGTIAVLLAFGLGTGLFTVPNTAAVMSAASRDRLGVIGGLMHTARYVGIIGGIALMGALYTAGRMWDPSDPHLGFRIAFGALAVLVGIGAVLTVRQGVPGEASSSTSDAGASAPPSPEPASERA